MDNNQFSRREFLGLGAFAGASLAGRRIRPARELVLDAPAQPPVSSQPSDRVRFGIVGVGMQGSGLLATAITVPGVECVAAADLYDGRHVLAREITNNPSLRVTRRYQELLDDKNIDAIIAAVPDHWHKQLVIDALNAGKDVYCEKPMSHTPADGVAMLDAARRTGRIVQIGSQRVSSPICAKARELIAQGMIGELTLVEGWNGRNDPTGAWQYPPPLDLSPANLDWDTWLGTAPKKPFDPITFARWRAWKEYGTGVAGDLLVHLVSGLLFMLDMNRPPTRVASVGGIRRWKDGRNMPDVHAAVYDYAGLPVYMRLNLGTEMPETYRFQGSKGILEMTGNTIALTPQWGDDRSPSYYSGSFPKAMRDAYVKQWHAENDERLARESMSEAVVIRGGNFDATKGHLANFFDAVRTRKPVVEDALFGHNAALACHLANESYFRQDSVRWDEGARTIKS
ncbi:oxidoreductase domain protein (plasmid) [Gemmatirosa kalamazoonensis]|uniref:Oxidoreductase domain protein n=1 Tax=Gemmatirosa kalamazoonensis TaxID=861299 RepID=W0RRV8_9BACT|nr:Gfo/Idh/MocA family oxidoreductase [Gemmatirosa kalamazoonensis]AHG92323.1 oxidoreductase domain protein [Gemmatirosa kalamazoonensis]